jgi:hypothetical protein
VRPGPPPPDRRWLGVTRRQCLDTLDSACAVAEARVRRAPNDRALAHQRDQLVAMAWWHGFYPEPAAYAPRTFTPAPVGKVYALQMILNVRWDAQQFTAGPDRFALEGEAA